MTFLIQWNCNGIYSHYNELKLLSTKNSPKIICIQETHFRHHHSFSFRGYKTYRYDFTGRNRPCGGVAILIQNNIPVSPLPLILDNLQANAVTIKTPEFHYSPVTVCNIYIPPHQSVTVGELENLLNQLPSTFIITGDFNAHCPIWGSTSTNNRGNILSKLLIAQNIHLLNNGSPTQFHLSNGTCSAIDLSFCSSTIAHRFLWQPETDLYFSDHFPLKITILGQQKMSYQKFPKWIVEKANWSKFQNELVFPQNYSGNIDSDVESLTNTILQAAINSIPKSSPWIASKQVPWWCPEIKEAISLRKKALRKYKKHSTDENLINFKKFRAAARRLVRIKQQESWNSFMQSISQNPSIKETWKSIKILKGSYIPNHISSLQDGNQTLTSHSDIAECFARFFSEVSSNQSFSPEFLSIKEAAEQKFLDFSSNNSELYNLPFTINELCHCLTHNIKNSSPGPDDIHPFMIKNLPDVGLKHLLNMFNQIWTSNSFPLSWKKSVIIPIPKPNKELHLPSSFRPISLTSVIGKIFEKMISKRLTWYLESTSCISSIQSGFRKKCSTLDHLLDLQQEIQTAFKNKEYHFSVFFDLEKAYDKSWRYAILKKLHSIGIRGHLAYFLKNFLENHSFQVRIGNTLSSIFPIQNGVPQGSVLSVSLFILLIDDITKILSPLYH